MSINQSVIHEAMKLYQIEYPDDCFLKVVTLGRHFIQKRNEELAAERGNKQ